jgi:molybdopterin molybdotransferase
LAGAAPETPAILTVTQKIHAGDRPAKTIGPGEAALVATGAPLPSGADCVAAQENTDGGGERVEVYVSLKKYQNYAFQGEHLRAGSLLADRGTRLKSAHIGLLAGQGVKELRVYPRPKIALLSVGSELVLPAKGKEEALLSPGMIYDSNSWSLAARVLELGGQAHVAGLIEDDPVQIAAALEGLLKTHDLVITAGGVSVGERDYMPQAGQLLNTETLFHGLGYKPGGSTLAMLKEEKLILCLSGNPFAALMSFELLARPVLRKLAGLKEPAQSTRIRAVLRGNFPKPSPHRRFIRGRLSGGEVFLEDEGRASLLSLSRCDCLIDIPAASPPLLDGAEVEVAPFYVT